MSHGGVNSSCDTTPEPSHGESPNRKQSEGIPYASNEMQSQGIQGMMLQHLMSYPYFILPLLHHQKFLYTLALVDALHPVR